MHTTNLRKVGGSVMLAVPPAILDLLHLGAGAKVALAVDDGRLVVEPQNSLRYTLDELLAIEQRADAHAVALPRCVILTVALELAELVLRACHPLLLLGELLHGVVAALVRLVDGRLQAIGA